MELDNKLDQQMKSKYKSERMHATSRIRDALHSQSHLNSKFYDSVTDGIFPRELQDLDRFNTFISQTYYH